MRSARTCSKTAAANIPTKSWPPSWPTIPRPVLAAVDENDRLLGYAFCMLEECRGSNIMNDRKTLYIDDLCVDETLRGQHIGRALFEAVKAYARARGCRDLTLNVWTGNEAARRFYESCGFKPRKTCMDYAL